ncbi:hypothetical protein RRG08_063542 [Elysia crispata]|uniref:Uncharacterized protein n=1 Tax=Elysia crispata TaxID=231223 RepID=A0AAE0YP57_9GAST|nr:hypothetical protein RRG08_063542 [Elysia crispata]
MISNQAVDTDNNISPCEKDPCKASALLPVGTRRKIQGEEEEERDGERAGGELGSPTAIYTCGSFSQKRQQIKARNSCKPAGKESFRNPDRSQRTGLKEEWRWCGDRLDVIYINNTNIDPRRHKAVILVEPVRQVKLSLIIIAHLIELLLRFSSLLTIARSLQRRNEWPLHDCTRRTM